MYRNMNLRFDLLMDLGYDVILSIFIKSILLGKIVHNNLTYCSSVVNILYY